MAKKLYINGKLAVINGKYRGLFNGIEWDNRPKIYKWNKFALGDVWSLQRYNNGTTMNNDRNGYAIQNSDIPDITVNANIIDGRVVSNSRPSFNATGYMQTMGSSKNWYNGKKVLANNPDREEKISIKTGSSSEPESEFVAEITNLTPLILGYYTWSHDNYRYETTGEKYKLNNVVLEVVESSDPNAYPERGIQNGYWYEKIIPLEYIETNGNQIINTGISDGLKITVDCKMYASESKGQYWFGSQQDSGSMMYNGLYNKIDKGSNLTTLEYNWIEPTKTSSNLIEMTQRIDGNNTIITMNGVQTNVPTGSVSPTGNMYIFGCNNGTRYFGAGLRLYYLKIYNNNVLVRDFIPVKSGNKCGLYDLISNTIFYNSNSSAPDFTAGPEKE